MASQPRPQLTHVGVFARDIDKMTAFYTDVFGLTVTDVGDISDDRKIVFMSSDPNEHHQFVLVSGRPDDDSMITTQQLSFLVDSLDDVRTLHDKVKIRLYQGTTPIMGIVDETDNDGKYK